jgi:RNA polymerase sigma-70 factor, ECF subfamily
LVSRVESALGGKLARLVDPQDIVQSVFRTLIRRSRDDGVRLSSGSDAWRLLLVITMNKIRKVGNFHRAAKRSINQTISLDHDCSVADRRPEDLDALINRMTLEEQLGRLAPEKRRMVEMYLVGMSIEEIAETASRASRTVYRAIRSFQETTMRLLDEDQV